MKSKLLATSIILILICSLIPPSQQVAASSFEVNYTLTLEQEDRPEVTIKVQGYPGQNAVFISLGSAGNNIPPLMNIFTDMEVIDLSGNNLAWQWVNKGISVSNGSVQDFTIRYTIDAINYQLAQSNHSPENKLVLFRFRRIFFIAGDVFLTPKLEPEKISVESSLPDGTTLYASLPSENGKFQAVRDLWGNLRDDFSKAYFAGGHALFTLAHTTDWGDEYQYIWFDRDPLLSSWNQLYGNTPWEQAKLYMESTETCASYFRDSIGPLPNHKVLFTNITHELDDFPSALTNQDWYHYMQIWPRYSEPEVCHHVFHQYSFRDNQSKLNFNRDHIGNMLDEGLPTYYEQFLPTEFSGDPRYLGKFFEFFVLDVRGRPFGIRENIDFHIQYNLSALKVYLLDQYIRSMTDGEDSLDGFVKAMWEKVKDNTTPQTISQADVLSAFSSVVGSENAGYLNDVANLSTFNLQEFEDLRSPFSAYADWMIQEYFWGKPILFYMYLDIAAAKGDNWPHFVTYPHNVKKYQQEALPPIRDYLSNRLRLSSSTPSERTLTQQDVLDGMQAATGQNHTGFFEFWESLNITLDPNEIKNLSSWDIGDVGLEDLLPIDTRTIGTLRTEHQLGGVTQKATIHLDTPAKSNQITVEYLYTQKNGFLSSDEIAEVIKGENVYVSTTRNSSKDNLKTSQTLFIITTDDPKNQDFSIFLTYPIGEGISSFRGVGSQQGDFYHLGSIDPIEFDLVNIDNEILLPDTQLENETYIVSNEDEFMKYKPGEKIPVSLTSGPIEVQVLDQYGFLRGVGQAVPLNQSPMANFGFDFSTDETQMTIQFTDTSNDLDGKIQSWFWEFGDGQTSIEQNPLYTYENAAGYSVSLTVTDDSFGSDTQIQQILVGSKPQNIIQTNEINFKWLLFGGGIFLAGGLVLILLPTLKKKWKSLKRLK
jgi:hypothetical protein